MVICKGVKADFPKHEKFSKLCHKGRSEHFAADFKFIHMTSMITCLIPSSQQPCEGSCTQKMLIIRDEKPDPFDCSVDYERLITSCLDLLMT